MPGPRFEDRDGARATVYLYGSIGKDWFDEGNDAKDFAQELDSLGGKPVDIRIDSGGGDVYAGFAMASAIQRYKGETTAHIDGMAASAASYVACVCDRVEMADYAVVMIHDSWASCTGNAGELREMAQRLEGIDEAIADVIAKRSALTLDEVRQAMHAETWYTAAEAAEAGICDEVHETEAKLAASICRDDAARCRHVPDWVTVTDGDPASHTPDTMPTDKPEAGRAVLLGNKVVRL